MAMEHDGSILMQKYELGRFLGQGTFAKVYHARNLKTSESVAIKVIDKEKVFKVGLIDQIKREISVMRLVRHPNVAQLYEVMASKTKIYFVLEYIRGGELFNKLAKGKLKEDVARKYFQQLISAVDFCHSRGVYHRDLKPENLLLDEGGNLKISDFGLSALADCKRQDGLLHTTCGTPAYVAPEVINRKGYDGAKADIWSCGVVLFVLMAGYLPFHDSNLMDMYRKIGTAEYKCPNWFSSDLRRLISRILDPNPATRISLSKIMENRWFRKGFDSKLLRRVGTETKEVNPVDVKVLFDYSEGNTVEKKQELDSSEGNTVEKKQELTKKLSYLNAFDIISLSAGLDLSGLLGERENKKEARFTSTSPASTIISKLKDVAKTLRLKVKKEEDGLLKLESREGGRKGVLAIDTEIFEVTPSFHLIEIRKGNGDTLEYQKLWKQEMRPALKDIVWAWQGDQLGDQPQHEQA